MLNAGKIDETNIDEFDIILLDEIEDFGRVLKHVSPMIFLLQKEIKK